jgi:hypothetical protein
VWCVSFPLTMMCVCLQKPRNLVLYEIETSTGKLLAWVAIDLDASSAIGSLAGQKVTSSASFPPEMARQELAKGAQMTRSADDLAMVVAEKKSALDDAMQSRERDVVATLSLELKQLEAELKYQTDGDAAEPVRASVQFEMWYFGCLLYQLCTEDGATLWDANQADNIDDEQLRQLAYQWPQIKPAKLKKIVWPQAAHLAGLLLGEHPQHRPKTWDHVLRHPFFASSREGGAGGGGGSGMADHLHSRWSDFTA